MKNKSLWIIAGLLATCMLFAGCDGSTGGEDPPLTGTVTITGTPTVGEVLTANTNNLSGMRAIFYQWKRANTQTAAGTDISGATNNSYELKSTDEDKYISVTVTRAGYSGSVTSDAVGAIEASNLPPLTGTVTITGTPTVGEILTVNTTDVVDALDENFSYQWRRAASATVTGTDISGATGNTYTLLTADLNSYLTVNIRNTAYSGSLTSNAIGPVTTGGGTGSTAELDAITIPNLMYYFYQEIALPTTSGGLAVSWTSDNASYPIKDYPSNAINQNLKRVMVRDNVEGTFNFNLIAKVTKSGVEYQRSFPVEAREKNYYGYLLAYFTGNDSAGEQVRYALSTDGYNFVALNSNRPVIPSSVGRTGGLRDPFVVRGHDGVFRMVITDMRSGNGWDSNRGIVMLKSNDLINWTSNGVHFPSKNWSGFGQNNINTVWAPETIYDRASDKYLVHFAIAGSGWNPGQRMFYSWANADFTDLTSLPVIMYAADNNASRIDLSVVNFNNVFHGVIKDEASTKHIEKLESLRIDGDYTRIATNIDNESNDVEGGELYRLIGTDTWVHMYDVYGGNRYGWKTSTNMRAWTAATGSTRLTPGGATFTPRHGSVIPITKDEYDTLNSNKVWMTTVQPPVVTTDAPLKLHYTFDTANGDSTGTIQNRAAGYTGTNNGSVAGSGGSLVATNTTYKTPHFYTGTGSAYVNMGTNAGAIINAQTNFTIASYVYIDSAASLSGNGWFLWCMANTTGAEASSGRYMFFRAVAVRQCFSTSGYNNESNVSLGGNLTKGKWQHVMYRQVGNQGTIYIDGAPEVTATTTIATTSLTGLNNNWIGRPCFSGDSYMRSTRYADFRVYGGAVSEQQIADLSIPAKLAQLNGN